MGRLTMYMLLSRTRARGERVPQEAYIGIVYVVFSAAMILVLTLVPHGGEEIRHLLVGAILWVSWSTALKTALIYGFLGIVLYFLHGTLHRISMDSDQARRDGISLARWDFIFYLILGTVVISSVQIAGVLLVFTLLVVPTVMAIRLFTREKSQFLYVLGIGTAAVCVGATASYVLDLPTGAAIVCTFGAFLAVQIIMERWLRSGG